jgi:PAS domain S-box-containing protein
MNKKPDIKSSLNILLVEDNPGDVALFKENLRDSGMKFELVHSSTLKDALKNCHENDFDVILLDLGLPDSVGIETLKQFSLSSCKAPIIVMTGLNDEETALTALQEGAQDYLVKNNLNAEYIVRSIRYSIERKKIQEYQNKITFQFSILASATASINESEDISSIYKVCCENIKLLLDGQNVFSIEYLEPNNPYTSYFDWLESFFHQTGKIDGIDFYQANVKIINRIQSLLVKADDMRVLEIKGGVNELLEGSYNPSVGEKIRELLEINNIYLLGFSREKRQYGGIFIFSKKEIESDSINILEVIAAQASLSIHRRAIEKDLVLSEQRYRMLNKKLEERVLERTKDLARTNALLEDELGGRIRLEQELVIAKEGLEIRVQERTAELKKSEERFHNMFYNHQAIMWLVNPETGAIVEANKSAEQFYGHQFNASKKFKIHDLNKSVKDEILKVLDGAVNRKNNYFIVSHQLASGEIRTVEVYTSPIEVNNETLLFSVLHDITERRQIENALKESETLYKTLVNNSLNIILISVDGRIEFANNAASGFCKIPVGEIIGRSIDEFFKTSLNGSGSEISVSNHINEAALNNRAVEIQVQNSLGISFHFLVGAGTIQYKGKNAVMSILTDITENKNVEQFVLNKIIETEENDKKRFAADLHDDLGPILSVIKLRLGLMENTGKPAEMRENIAISNELMGLVIEKVRSLSQTIAPNLLESLGLDSAIRDLCKRVILQTKISLEFKSGIENIRFPQSVELHFYRIISELINNSLKHSDAKIIHINLRCMNDTLKLTYYDDGKGYDLQDSFQKQSGIGLHNILNRVNLINGTIDFQQDKGKTVVKISKKMDPVASN